MMYGNTELTAQKKTWLLAEIRQQFNFQLSAQSAQNVAMEMHVQRIIIVIADCYCNHLYIPNSFTRKIPSL